MANIAFTRHCGIGVGVDRCAERCAGFEYYACAGAVGLMVAAKLIDIEDSCTRCTNPVSFGRWRTGTLVAWHCEKAIETTNHCVTHSRPDCLTGYMMASIATFTPCPASHVGHYYRGFQDVQSLCRSPNQTCSPVRLR